jgi:Uma2 family endonuclease
MGDVLGAETGFMLSREGEPDTVLAPDMAFISAARAPRGSETGFARVAPDLVVEVASPGQPRVQMDAKSRLYFQAGTRAVWVVWPATRTVDIRQSGGSRTLGDDDVLEAEDILPGLRIGVRQLFG